GPLDMQFREAVGRVGQAERVKAREEFEPQPPNGVADRATGHKLLEELLAYGAPKRLGDRDLATHEPSCLGPDEYLVKAQQVIGSHPDGVASIDEHQWVPGEPAYLPGLQVAGVELIGRARPDTEPGLAAAVAAVAVEVDEVEILSLEPLPDLV